MNGKLTRVFLCLIFLSLVLISEVFAQYSELIGKKIQLRAYSSKGVVYVGIDKESFNTLIGTLMTRDKQAYLLILLSRRGFEVNNFTTALILDIDFFERAAKVKILEGGYAGKVGWVLLEQVVGY